MISTNLATAVAKIRKSCERTGRNPGEVRIMAVTKSVPVSAILEAKDAGLVLFGENRAQEARQKVSEGVFKSASICMIGHLQTNKASLAVRTFDEVHSIDSVRIADAVARYASRYRQDPLPVLMEVNAGRDPAKYGVAPEEAFALARHITSLPTLRLKGMMTVAPIGGGPEKARECFRTLRALRDEMVRLGIDPGCMKELSMGMSGDFDIAVEEGATIVRLGTSLFGPRPSLFGQTP
jgi:pyridoxal phosphate enzyme (YggS family)